MYSGKNPSALRSQRWIAQALLELLQTQKLPTITVKQICQKADLTRQTFYQFFQTKEDVIRYLLMGYAAQFQEALLSQGAIGLEQLTEIFFSFFHQHQDFILLLIDNHMEYLMTEQFCAALPGIMDFCIRNDQTRIRSPHIYAFLAGGLSAMLLSFLKSDDGSGEEALKQQFLRLFSIQT